MYHSLKLCCVQTSIIYSFLQWCAFIVLGFHDCKSFTGNTLNFLFYASCWFKSCYLRKPDSMPSRFTTLHICPSSTRIVSLSVRVCRWYPVIPPAFRTETTPKALTREAALVMYAWLRPASIFEVHEFFMVATLTTRSLLSTPHIHLVPEYYARSLLKLWGGTFSYKDWIPWMVHI